MNADDRARMDGIRRAILNDVQRYARTCERATEDRVEVETAKMRGFVYGLKAGLTAMGMQDGAAKEVIRAAGWDFTTSSYHLIERPSVFAGLDNGGKGKPR